jgi:tellurite methyltransferase
VNQSPSSIALLDVRAEADFQIAHAPDAANIPLEQLAASSHELPSASKPLRVTDADPTRAVAASEILARRGHRVEAISLASLDLSATGPATVRLWSPNPFLIEAFHRSTISQGARALDVACGSGRDAVWLALQGMRVDAIDHLPDALQRAESLGRRNRVPINAIQKDVEADPTLPTGYDLVCVFRYLHRPLWPAIRNAVTIGGHIIYETFHSRTREAGGRPSSPDHLLETGELAAAFDGFDILISRDAVERDGRYFSSLLARRNAGS